MLGKNLKTIRKNKGITQQKLAKDFNVAIGTVSMWETDKRDPDSYTIARLAQYFNVSVDYLLGIGDVIKDIGEETFTNLSNVKYIKIPIFGTIPAGIPIDMIEDTFIEDYEEIDASLLRGGQEYFGLKIKGTSMVPEFRDGDTIILKKQDDCNNGDFCAVSINHTECTFKKVLKKETGLTLMPLNPEFEPLFFTNQEVIELPITILGVVKEVRRSY